MIGCELKSFMLNEERHAQYAIILSLQITRAMSEMTLNYRMMVERYPNLKEEVGDSNHGCEISSLPDKNLPSCQLPHVLWRWPVSHLSQKRKKKKKRNHSGYHLFLHLTLANFCKVLHIPRSHPPTHKYQPQKLLLLLLLLFLLILIFNVL
jgi:hypothetical protein